jgi:hypothetical protein
MNKFIPLMRVAAISISLPARGETLLWTIDEKEGEFRQTHVISLTWVNGKTWHGPQIILGPLVLALVFPKGDPTKTAGQSAGSFHDSSKQALPEKGTL